MLVDVAPVQPIPVPTRRTLDGAVVADWGQVPARVSVAGLSGDGRRTMTACLRPSPPGSRPVPPTSTPCRGPPCASPTPPPSAPPWPGRSPTAATPRPPPTNTSPPSEGLSKRPGGSAPWPPTTTSGPSTSDPCPAADSPPAATSNTTNSTPCSPCAPPTHDPPAPEMLAIIAVAYLSGGRRAELAGLHLADLDLDPPAIRVVGKGGKQRLVPLSPTATPTIESWLAWRGNQPGPLFCPIDRADNVRHGHSLSGEAIRQVLGRRSLAAGVNALSPHDLRRSYAGDLLDAGADLPAVQQLLGHASPATTSRYDRRGDKARRTAAERLHIDIPTATATTTALS